MKKLLALLLALMLPCAALAESYNDVAKHYLNTYGKWWDYSQELWLEYAAATRASDIDASGGSTARAIAATDYILPPEDALSYEEAAAIAISAANPDAQARPLAPCFMLDGRAMYKVILYVPGADSSFSQTVEMDAMTGEVLGVYPYLTVEAGYLFVPNKVWVAASLQYSPEELSQMTWSQLADAYIARHGTWWDWNSVRWGEFVTAVRQVDVSSSRTGRAVAATEYIRSAHEMLMEEEAKDIACAAMSGEAKADNLVLCFLHEGRAMFKVIVRTADMVYSVELDAYTGEILGLYPQTSEGVGQFFVPHALWEATPETAPNG